MKKQRGITLIALIITIIVMLILVAVTVNVALNGGLFTTANKAKEKTESALVVENMTAIIVAERADNLNYTATEMREVLKEKGFVKEDGITINTEQFIGRQDDHYIISADGTIRYWGEKIGFVDTGLNSKQIETKIPDYGDSLTPYAGLDITIKVVEGDIEESSKAFKIIAPAERKDGKIFSHWEDDYGYIVSYSSTFEWDLLEGKTYTPIYINKNEANERKNIITFSIMEGLENKLGLVTNRDFDINFEVVGVGVLLTTDIKLATNENLTIEKYNEIGSGNGIKRSEINSTANKKCFFTNLNMSAKTDRYFRAYVKYTNSQGEECIDYSNIMRSSAENQIIE